MITADNYIQRRRRLAQLAQQPLIVIAGGDLVQKSSDETYEFEQDGYFYYLTGIDEPGWTLVMDVQRGDEFLISTNESDYHDETWEALHSNEDITRQCGVSDIRTRRDGWAFLRKEVSNYQSLGSIVPKMRFSRPFGMFIGPAKTMLVERLRRIHKDANLVDISAHIRTLRSVKDEDEIAEMRKGIAVTKLGYDRIVQNLQNYQSEAEIVADLTHEFIRNHSKHGYTPIVASGKNAAIIHYKHSNQPIERNNLLLMDIGATPSGRYSADISRTYAIGQPPQRQLDVLSAVKEAQAEAFNFLKPGITMRDFELHIEQFIGEQLNRLGIIDTMLRQDIRRHYPHAISHHIGVDLHDGSDYERPLEPGMIITVEPGIYTQEEGIGVRLEEDVLITKDGFEILTQGIGEL